LQNFGDDQSVGYTHQAGHDTHRLHRQHVSVKTESNALFKQQALVVSRQFTKAFRNTVVNVVRLCRIRSLLLCSRHGNLQLRADQRVIPLLADTIQRGGFTVS